MNKLRFFKLNNGINLIHLYIPDFPIALSSFWIKAGSRSDPKGKEGLAHFFEHILTTRTKNFPNRQRRLIEIEKQGFLSNATTSLETANYYLIHSPENIEGALDLLIDGLVSSIFEDKDINEERQVIIDEERRNRNDPGSYIWRLANSGLWPESQMGSSFFGDINTIEKISKDDILNFYDTYYKPQNATFLLINSSENTDVETHKLEKIKTSDLKMPVNIDRLGAKKNVVFVKRDLDYSQIAFSFLTTNSLNTDDQIVLDLIKNYLASGWMSRLVMRLRIQEKLTYWVSSYSDKFKDTGFLRFTVSIDTGKMDKVLKIFEEEILSLKNETIQNSTLDQHKIKYKNDMLRSTLDINFLNSWYASDFVASDKTPLMTNEYIEKMMKVSPKQIQTVAKTYLNKDNFSLAIIGRKQEIEYLPNFQ